MAQETITMSQKESLRYEIIKNLIDKKINGAEADKQMDLSLRQVKRIKARVLKEGLKGIIHRNRGRAGNRILDPKMIEKAKHFLQTRYFDFKPTFAMEKSRPRKAIFIENLLRLKKND